MLKALIPCLCVTILWEAFLEVLNSFPSEVIKDANYVNIVRHRIGALKKF